MKSHAQAQAILLYSGHPLEPIVAREIQKSFKAERDAAARRQALWPHIKTLQTTGVLYLYDQHDTGWFANYE